MALHAKARRCSGRQSPGDSLLFRAQGRAYVAAAEHLASMIGGHVGDLRSMIVSRLPNSMQKALDDADGSAAFP